MTDRNRREHKGSGSFVRCAGYSFTDPDSESSQTVSDISEEDIAEIANSVPARISREEMKRITASELRQSFGRGADSDWPH